MKYLAWITPARFEKFFTPLLITLTSLSLITLTIGLIMIWMRVPDDYLQKELVKIMYIHVPAAWLSLILYALLTAFGILFLIFNNPFYDIISKSFARVGSFMALITLLTGSIWGKPTWGAWWVWDARLTSMLILFIIYVTYLLLRNSFTNQERTAKVCAIFALMGLINIPIIKFSVYLWNTLHQGSSIIRLDGPSIHISMLYPLFLMFIGYIALTFLFIIIEIKSEIYARKFKAIIHI